MTPTHTNCHELINFKIRGTIQIGWIRTNIGKIPLLFKIIHWGNTAQKSGMNYKLVKNTAKASSNTRKFVAILDNL